MCSIQQEIKSKIKDHNLGNVFNWVSVKDALPEDNSYVLIKRSGFIPYVAFLSEDKWFEADHEDSNQEVKPDYWTEIK